MISSPSCRTHLRPNRVAVLTVLLLIVGAPNDFVHARNLRQEVGKSSSSSSSGSSSSSIGSTTDNVVNIQDSYQDGAPSDTHQGFEVVGVPIQHYPFIDTTEQGNRSTRQRDVVEVGEDEDESLVLYVSFMHCIGHFDML